MKKILILLFFVPFLLHGQRDYPVRDSLLSNDFTSNITGFSAFNGGTIAHNAGAGTMTITTTTANSRGAIMATGQAASSRYHVYIKASAGTASSITVYGQWANVVAVLSLPCDTVIAFTSAAAPGGFGSSLVITPLTVGNVEIDEFRMFRVIEKRLIPTRAETFGMIGGEIKKRNIKSDPYGRGLNNDFSENSAGISGFTGSISVANGFLTVSGPGNNLVIAATGAFSDTCTIRYKIKVDIVDHPIVLYSVWTSPNRDTIYTSGEYTGYLHRAQTVGALNGFAIATLNTGGTIKLDYLILEELGNPFLIQNKTYLQIGYNINARKDISPKIGINIRENVPATSGQHTTVGSNVNNGTLWTRFFGSGYTTGEGVTIGNSIYNASARTTVIGEESVGVGQSGTTIGSGAEGYTIHGITLGRGGYNPNYPHPTGSAAWSGGDAFLFEAADMYGRNGSWHRSPQPVSGQSRLEYPGNTSRYFAVHGPDAFDSRHPQWTNSFSYSQYDIVFHNDSSWFSLTNSNLNSAPTITNSNWYFWQRDNQGPASEFNVPGAPLNLVAGKATGSAESGAVNLVVGVGNNGPNTKDSDLVAVQVRSEQSITPGKTHLWLYDPATASLKQVLKADKPAAAGTNGIRGFARLSL